ncbi:MAG: RNase adapter RapZ, partial [Desulfobacterales bacterium]
MKNITILILTGLSGSGKSTALAALEDTGFFCIDNMPVDLLPKFLEMPMEPDSEITGIGLV